jgi:two-component system, LytTR family, response regulator
MITAIIVDDEALAREAVRIRVEREPDMRVVGEFGSAAEAAPTLMRTPPDIVFLDVELPDADGFTVLNAMHFARPPAVVFVTAHDKHAVRAFGVQALDYILKPFDDARFANTLTRIRAYVASPLCTPENANRTDSDRVAIRVGDSIEFVSVESIEWVEAAGDYVRVHVGPRSHLVRITITALSARLKGRLVRIHRSVAVNASQVASIRPISHGDYTVILRSGQQLRLSRRYRDQLAAALEAPL